MKKMKDTWEMWFEWDISLVSGIGAMDRQVCGIVWVGKVGPY